MKPTRVQTFVLRIELEDSILADFQFDQRLMGLS